MAPESLNNSCIFPYESLIHVLAFLVGFLFVVLTIFLCALHIRIAARSQLNRIVFGALRRGFNFLLRFAKTYQRWDAIMAYYAPVGIMLLVPTWFALILLGYAAMYMSPTAPLMNNRIPTKSGSDWWSCPEGPTIAHQDQKRKPKGKRFMPPSVLSPSVTFSEQPPHSGEAVKLFFSPQHSLVGKKMTKYSTKSLWSTLPQVNR